MELKDCIKIYDNALPPQTVGSLIKWLHYQKFSPGLVGDKGQINKNIRNADVLDLTQEKDIKITGMHWRNLLAYIFNTGIKQYGKDVSPHYPTGVQGVREISVLKYDNCGFYEPHVDHFHAIPRLFSSILLLNNDYEGGQLCFTDPINKSIIKTIDVQVGRLIVWPSIFLFPHGVKPVTKGIRYAVVGWAF
jgi:Rps23 Pro-64 3,4-dihydroxylase Tpa1-like proline 4-hydroxylase